MTRRLPALGAIAALVALAVGVPVFLIIVAGWPLPTQVPDWDRVRTAIQQGDIPSVVVIKTIAALVWVAWAQLMWALGWELAVNVPAGVHGRRPKATPLVPAGMSAGIGRLVALAFTITLATTSTVSSVLAVSQPVAATVPAALPPASTSPPGPPTGERDLPGELPRWRAQSGDSLWAIAETTLGDGSRYNEILELNPTLPSPRALRPGHVLLLPVDAAVPADRTPPAETTSDDETAATTIVVDAPVPTHLPEQLVVITPGDNLWKLAEQRLASATGTPALDSEVSDYVDEVVAANRDTIDDADLIHPGDEFAFPPIGAPPPVVDAPTDAQTEPATPHGDPATTERAPTDAGSASSTKSTPVSTMSVTVASTDTPATTTPTSSTSASAVPPSTAHTGDTAAAAATSPATGAIARAAARPVGEQRGEAGWPTLAGLTGATVVSTGLLLTYRRLRQRQAATGARHAYRQLSNGDQPDIERAIVAAADVPMVRWAAHELRRVLTHADVVATLAAAPVAVEISAASGIEILWDVPTPNAPPPWTAADGGWAWRRDYDPDEPIAADAVNAVIPGLITIGQRDGHQVLLDLEGFGSLAITGETDHPAAALRSILLEAAAGDDLANAQVHAVDRVVTAVGHLPRAQQRDATGALLHLRAIVEGHQQVLLEAGLSSTFQLRSLHDPDGRELTIVAVDSSSDVVDEMVAVAEPRRGAAVLILGEHPSANATLRIAADASATLEPLGLHLTAVGLSTSTQSGVEALLDDAARPLMPDDLMAADASDDVDAPAPGVNGRPYQRELPLAVGAEDAGDDETFGVDEDAEGDDWQPPAPGLLVKVLGSPRIEGVDTLRPTDVSLVAFLACRGGSSSEDQVINAVWCGRAVEKATLWNHITKIRAAIGAHMPPRAQGRGVCVGEAVMTDLAILERYIEEAAGASSGRAIELLCDAVALVDGPPFDAPGYEWAYEHQLHARACAAVETATLRLVDLAIDANDIATARMAITQGLRALPVNEPLYRARMRVEAHDGNRAGVRAAYDELARQLDELAGNGDGYAPSARTNTLLAELTGTTA